MAPKRVFVVGVGMTKFEKPGRGKYEDYPQYAKAAVEDALADAGVPYSVVEQAVAGYVYGDSTCGQRALYEVGMTGIPISNVNSNCSTGSTALYLAKQFVQGGLNECVLALGFEKMQRGSLKNHFDDRTNPMDKHITTMMEKRGFAPKAPPAAQLFGNAGVELIEKHGVTARHLAKIAEKNHRHSAANPRSQFRDIYTLEQVEKSPKVFGPLTKLQCCPTSDGAAAAILCSEEFVYKYGLQGKAVEILGMSLTTDTPASLSGSSIELVGYSMAQRAAQDVYRQAGAGPESCQVVELHDCFSANEAVTYAALGLCTLDGIGKFIDSGDNTYGGKYVVNPSGGLISKGHPLGATGLAQCAELCWQVRGLAEKRQVKGATRALQHNLGLGGAAVVTMYEKAKFGGAAPAAPRLTRPEWVGAAPKEAPAAAAAAAAAAPAGPSAEEQAAAAKLKAGAFFKQLEKRVNADLCKKVRVVYRFDVSEGDTKVSWVVDLKNAPGGITIGQGKADCIIVIKDGDFVKLMAGKLNPQQAFMQGKLKIKGNMMLAQKLSLLMEKKASL